MGEDEIEDYNDAVWAQQQENEQMMLLEDPDYNSFLDRMEE